MTGYDEALNRVIELRKKRREIYGDAWRNNKHWILLAHAFEKINRLEHFAFNENNNNYESEIDCLIDLSNYTLFMLQLKLEEKQHEKKL